MQCLFNFQDFQLKQKVQALDPETNHWLLAQVAEIEETRIKIKWPSYDKSYDCWLGREQVRQIIPTRTFSKRNAIRKVNFIERDHPKFLQSGDEIIDINSSNQTSRVSTNDPFKCEV